MNGGVLGASASPTYFITKTAKNFKLYIIFRNQHKLLLIFHIKWGQYQKKIDINSTFWQQQ